MTGPRPKGGRIRGSSLYSAPYNDIILCCCQNYNKSSIGLNHATLIENQLKWISHWVGYLWIVLNPTPRLSLWGCGFKRHVKVFLGKIPDDGAIRDRCRHPVDRGLACWLGFGRLHDLFYTLFHVIHQPFSHTLLGVNHGDAEVKTWGELEGIQVPAFLREGVHETVHIEIIRGNGEDHCFWFTHHSDARDALQTLDHVPGGGDDAFGGVHITILSHVHQSGPCGGYHTASSTPLDARSGVDTTLPVSIHKVLFLTQCLVGVQQNRGALWCVPILVGVSTDGGHSLDAEVERVDLEACLLHEREDEASQAAVDMHANAMLAG